MSDAKLFTVESVREVVKMGLRDHHIDDDDCWYSCPMSGESSDPLPIGCSCGASRHNEKLEEAFERLTGEKL